MESPSSYVKHHKYLMISLIIFVILSTAVGTRLLEKNNSSAPNNQLTKVKLVEVKEFLKNRGTITANGTVESFEQADLRSQGSGQVTGVLAKIGQKVVRGQILVTLQQSDAAAGLAQAKASLKTQQIRLEEMKKGARTEQLDLAETALTAAKQALNDTKNTQDAIVSNAYSNLLNAGLAITPNEYNVSKARLSLSGSYLLNKEGSYQIKFPTGGDKPPYNITGIETENGWAMRGSAIVIGKSGLFFTVSLEGDIYPGDSWSITIPNNQSPMYAAAKNGYETAIKARDAAVNGATSAVLAAQKQYDLLLAGATSDQIKAQEAAVEQANASVQAMSAQLEKTVIRSPINGEVAGITVKYGELVSPGALVAKVVSKGGLQVKTYISEYDLPYVKVGAEVLINENVKGKITNLSPSLDASTKNIEAVAVVESPEKSGLVVGQNAVIKINVGENEEEQVYLLPIQAVQISNESASVFTVDSSSTLKSVTVKLGEVKGEYVEVLEGLNPEMKIVSAVYELKPDEKVSAE